MSGNSFDVEGFLRLNSQDYRSGINKAENETEEFADATESASDRAESSLSSSLSSMGQTAKDAGLSLTAGVTAPLGLVGASAVTAASDAEEARARFNSIFDETGNRVSNFSENFAEKIGRSSRTIRNMAADFGSMLNPMVDSEERAAELSTEFTTLTQDLASFENKDPAKVQRDLQSALAGQSETVRKYGVDLSAARVEQELLAMGIKGGREEATRAQKAQARLNAIMKDTQSAQGNAAATSDSFQNRTRALRGSLRDLKVEVGKELMPTAKALVDRLQSVSDTFTGLPDSAQSTIAVIGAVAAAMGPVLLIAGQLASSIGALAGVFGTVAGAVGGLGSSLGVLLGPVGLLVVAVGALAFIFRDELIAITQKAIEILKGLAKDAVPVVRNGFETLGELFQDTVEALEPVFQFLNDVKERAVDLGQEILSVVEPAVGDVVEMLKVWAAVLNDTVVPAVQTVVDVAVNLAGTLGDTLEPAVDPVLTALQRLTTVLENTVIFAIKEVVKIVGVLTDLLSGDFSGAIQSARQFFDTAVSAILSTARNLLPDVASAFVGLAGEAVTAVQNLASDVVSAFSNLGSSIVSTVAGFASTVVSEFASLASSVLNAVSGAVGDVVDEYTDMVTSIVSAVTNGVSDAVSAATDFASSVGSAIVSGITATPGAVAGAITDLISSAVNLVSGLAQTVSDISTDIVSAIVDGITGAAQSVGDAVIDLISGAIDKVTTGATTIADTAMEMGTDVVDGIVDGITSAPGAILDAINGVLPDAIPMPAFEKGSLADFSIGAFGRSVNINIPPSDIGIPDIPLPELNTGGFIEDSGLAELHEGERVVPEEQVDELGGLEPATVDDRGAAPLSMSSPDAGTTVTIEYIEVNADSEDAGETVVSDLKSELKREGFRQL